MAWLNRLRRRLSALLRKGELDREMDEELRFHIEMEAEELARTRGLSPQEARRQAMLAFGGMERVREEGRDARGVRMLEELLADLRFAARMCLKHTGFAAATVLTLGLGIGASTAVFRCGLRRLVEAPSVRGARAAGEPAAPRACGQPRRGEPGPRDLLTYLDNQRAFDAIGAWELDEASITGRGDPEQVEVLTVSHTTLPLLRVQPVLGRLFSAQEDAPGGPPRVVLTSDYWLSRFGGAEDVVGQALEVDGVGAEIIGVLPSSFRFLDSDPAVLLPMGLNRAEANDVEFDFQVLARLKPGVTLPQANSDVARMISLLPPVFEVLQLQPYVRPLADDVTGDIGRVLWILLAAVGVVLLIACGNVANLFLIRVEARQQELAMRTALGASRGRIARVLLSESVLLAIGGRRTRAGAGTRAALGVLRWIAPGDLPRVEEIGIDPTVLLFALSISVLSGALFGLFAVLRFGSPSVTGTQGRRPLGERRPRAAPHAQRPGRVTGRTGADADDRLRV